MRRRLGWQLLDALVRRTGAHTLSAAMQSRSFNLGGDIRSYLQAASTAGATRRAPCGRFIGRDEAPPEHLQLRTLLRADASGDPQLVAGTQEVGWLRGAARCVRRQIL